MLKTDPATMKSMAPSGVTRSASTTQLMTPSASQISDTSPTENERRGKSRAMSSVTRMMPELYRNR